MSRKNGEKHVEITHKPLKAVCLNKWEVGYIETIWGHEYNVTEHEKEW